MEKAYVISYRLRFIDPQSISDEISEIPARLEMYVSDILAVFSVEVGWFFDGKYAGKG